MFKDGLNTIMVVDCACTATALFFQWPDQGIFASVSPSVTIL